MRPSDPSAADAPTVIRSDGSATYPTYPPTHTPGQSIGPFELISPLGVGGMATVWKANDREMGREVALKILPPELARDADHVARFKLEARAAAALDHPVIAKAFQCGEWDGVHAIAFEFVPGETLRQRLERDGPLAAKDAVSFLLDLAAGLAHASGRGVVHRDVKPANVVVTPDGRAKLIDMGLARRQDAGATNGGVTTSGVTLGTFDYLSPEQALDPRKADVRSDLYSLGCTFYHVLTGRPPVPEGTAARKLQAHQHERPADPRTWNPSIPDDLAVVLSRLMRKRPDDRYQTPAELERDLRILKDQLHAPAGTVVPRLTDPVAPIPVSWVVAALSVAAAIVLVVGISSPKPTATIGPSPSLKTSPPTPELPGPTASVPAVSEDGYHLATTVDELVTLLRDGVESIRLDAGREYDLSAVDSVVFMGRSLVLETATGRPPAILILPATAPNRDGAPTFRGSDSVELRRLVVRTIPPPFEDGPVIEPCGLSFERVGHVALSECRFETHERLRAGKAAAVQIEAEPKTVLTMRACTFPVGSVAVRVTGTVTATVTESAFGPHEAVFDLDGGRGSFAFGHCTFLFRPDGGAAFDVANDAAFALTAGHCVFAAAGPPPVPAMMMGLRNVPVLIRAEMNPIPTTFAAIPGEPNVYFRVDAAAFGEFVVPFEKRTEARIDESAATVLAGAPWAETDPLAALADAADPWRAFRGRLDSPALRVPRDVIVGVRHRTADGSQRIYPGDWPPPRPADLATETVKVWWPAAPDGETLPRNASRRLEELLAVARPGDTIEIRHAGKLPLRPIRPIAPDLNLTVRAAAGSRPVLIPDPTQRGPDGCLFDVAEGSLTLEGLDFLLTGRREGNETRTLTVARLSGGSSVTLRRCVVTLDEADEKAAAVVVAGSDAEMMRGPVGAAPRVRFEECLIRGTGRGTWVRSARPFALDATNTVAALDGPFLLIDPPTRELPATARGKLTLSKLTAALAGPLVEMKAGRGTDGRPLVLPIDVDSSHCFFAAVGPSRPLFVVDGGDPTDAPNRVLNWQSDHHARYMNWDRTATMFEVRPADVAGGATPLRLDADEWLRQVTREPGRSLSRSRPTRFPDSPRALAEATATDFIPPPSRRTDPLTPAEPSGADTATLPKPVE